MQDSKIRLAFFSLGGSEYRQIEMSWRTFVVLLFLSLVVLACLAIGILWSLSQLYQNHQLAQIERNHQQLRERLNKWEQQVREVASAVESVNGESDDLKSAVDLPQVPSTTQIALVDADDNVDPVVTSEPLEITDARVAVPATDFLGQLESALRYNRAMQKAIATRFERDGAEAQHLPSIRPLVSDRITDLFGKRFDPFVDRVRHHNGLDIGAPRGTEIYSPAAGVVEFVKLTYRRHRGYGRVVIIDHGNGIKTLYGHLSRIDVKHGQKIDRWQVIGEVGETGRATGPHLHYEVWVNGRAKDPMQFILN